VTARATISFLAPARATGPEGGGRRGGDADRAWGEERGGGGRGGGAWAKELSKGDEGHFLMLCNTHGGVGVSPLSHSARERERRGAPWELAGCDLKLASRGERRLLSLLRGVCMAETEEGSR